MFIGSFFSGIAVDFFSTRTATGIVRNWTSFWITSSVAAFLLLLVFAFLFESRRMIQKQEELVLMEIA